MSGLSVTGCFPYSAVWSVSLSFNSPLSTITIDTGFSLPLLSSVMETNLYDSFNSTRSKIKPLFNRNGESKHSYIIPHLKGL